jgi:hypothetical protein
MIIKATSTQIGTFTLKHLNRVYTKGTEVSLQHMVLGKLHIHMRRMEFDP